MEIHHNLSTLSPQENCLVTIGSFDGLHYGHKRLLEHVEARAKSLQVPSILITFDPHPKEVLLRDEETLIELLTTTVEKINILQQECDIDHSVILPFSHEFSQIRALDFLVQYIIEPFQPSEIVIGYDHTFGKGREGDATFLQDHEQEFDYHTSVVDEVALPGGQKSQQYANSLVIKTGNTLEAAQCLARPYQVNGTVIPGAQRGRIMEFPTANIIPDNGNKLLPQDGVYLVFVTGETTASYGMCNIGYRPTFDDSEHTVEVHLLTDPGSSLYHKTLTVHFFHHLRDEQEFDSPETLVKQLHRDKEHCQQIIAKENPWKQYQEEQVL